MPPSSRKRSPSKKNQHAPRIRGTADVGNLLREIASFTQSFKHAQFLELTEAAKKKDGKAKIKVPAGALGQGRDRENALMMGMGWYWEPLLHDINFFEQMRDSIAILQGEYQKFTDLVMKGFALQSSDEKVQQEITDALINDPNVDFYEVVRSSVYELASVANFYKRPIWDKAADGKPGVFFRPIRITAMRKLRDENLRTEGYVQLLHRPSEFLMGPPKSVIPTFYTADEIVCGIAYSHGWYAYGAPLMQSVPFILKMKLQMEKDLAELLHQHVPRIVITYTPDDQMTQEQVDNAINDLNSQISRLKPSDNISLTPDTVLAYAGPLGKALDFTGTQNHIEDQFGYVLPLLLGVLGKMLNINPYLAQQSFQLSVSMADHIRRRIEVAYAPVLKRLCAERGINKDAFVKITWAELDQESAQKAATTEEMHANTAMMQRDSGFIDQDTAAKRATRSFPHGPVKKAAQPGKLPDPNQIDPKTGKPYPSDTAAPGSGKISDKNRGPRKDGKTGGNAPDKRPKGKRHGENAPTPTGDEQIDAIVHQAWEDLGHVFDARELGLESDPPEDEEVDPPEDDEDDEEEDDD